LARSVLQLDRIATNPAVDVLDEHLVAQVAELYRIAKRFLPVGPDLKLLFFTGSRPRK